MKSESYLTAIHRYRSRRDGSKWHFALAMLLQIWQAGNPPMVSIYTIQDGCRAAGGSYTSQLDILSTSSLLFYIHFFILMEARERSWMLAAYWSPVTRTSASNSFDVIELFHPAGCYVPPPVRHVLWPPDQIMRRLPGPIRWMWLPRSFSVCNGLMLHWKDWLSI